MDTIEKERGQITRLLAEWSEGRPGALDELLPIVHCELKRIASRALQRERRDHTLEPSALVNEAFLRLLSQNRAKWESRGQFFTVSAIVMRRILVDYARRRRAEKRGSGLERVSLAEILVSVEPEVDLLDLERALRKLERLDPRQAELVTLRVFSGCTIAETADALSISPRTVKREWRAAQAWLRGELVT